MAEAERLGVRGHVVFGGRVPEGEGGFTARAMARNIPNEFHDRRDWDEIDAWAQHCRGAMATAWDAVR